jgi:two-component system NtrC family sensor kinase
MSGLPIPLVLQGAALKDATCALDAAELWCRSASPGDAAESVNGGWADVVILGRFPGWQALAARVQNAGGAALLWGEPPGPSDLRILEASSLEAVQDASFLPAAVRRARDRLALQREPQASDPQVDRAHAASLVSRFAQSIALQLTVDQVVTEAIARTRDLCDADGATLLLVDPGTGALTPAVLHDHRVAAEAARTATAVRVEDLRQAPWLKSERDPPSGFVAGSVIAAPLVLAGDLLGVVEAVRGVERPAFGGAHLQRMVDLAAHVSIAIYNAQITARLREAQSLVLRDNAELEQRIAQRTSQIALAKREWEATFDAISEPIAVQEGFVLRRANLAWARRAGVPITRLTGRRCHELFAGRASPCPGCPLAAAGGDLQGEVTANGSTYRFSGFRLEAPEGGSAQGRVVVHYEDVTRQRALEQRLRQTERLAALGQLASGAAHEINNPMAFLASNLSSLRHGLQELAPALDGAREAAELLRRGEPERALAALAPLLSLDAALAQESVEMVQEALQGAQRVKEIVRALRELSRQQLSQASTACPNAAITRALRSELGAEASLARVELGEVGEAVIDPLQLDQALSHLLRNARQAVGGAQGIAVRSFGAGAEIVVEVEDQGCGMPAEHLTRVFEPFFTTRGVGKGIGLGLTAAWGILERHGGRIEVRSEPGRGSCFSLHLRRAQPPPPAV